MRIFTLLFLLLATPSNLLAQDFHKDGFFDSEVSQTGFFSESQAGIPIKNDTGVITTRPTKDSWEVQPDKFTIVVRPEAQAGSVEKAKTEVTSSGDSFEVKKESTD